MQSFQSHLFLPTNKMNINANRNSLSAAIKIKFLGLLFFNYFLSLFSADKLPYYAASGNFVFSCPESDPSFNGRPVLANKLISNFSTVSRMYAVDPDLSGNDKPIISACIFRKQYTFSFSISRGPKFIRLCFKPTTLLGLDLSNALFSVSVGQYKLLTTSESSYSELNSDAALVKEFSTDIDGPMLNVTFNPSSKILSAYAFINKIEVTSMPSNLYIQQDVAVPLLRHDPSHFYLQKDRALETMYRLNIGGDEIVPSEDTGLFRRWNKDTDFVMSAKGETSIIQSEVQIEPSSSVAAPVQIYSSARSILDTSASNYSARWLFGVDSGFYYLVRLHFCEITSLLQQANRRVFHIYINNQTAEDHADIFQWSHGAGIPIYKDYIVDFSRSNQGKMYLMISMRHINGSLAGPILNGLEIFKLSDRSNNLAGSYPFGFGPLNPNLEIPSDKQTRVFTTAAHIIGMGFIAITFLGCVFNYSTCFRQPLKTSKQGPPPDHCRVFSITDMTSATNNFSDSLLIGTGGFGQVFRGSIDGGSIIAAIKRANPGSHQGLKEFQTEISMLSKLRHCHLVSLIGYSTENNEMILVYDYMAQGTLRDHLYKTHKPPLPWKQRLKICIGAARGLHYLHTGASNTIIHRDIKSTNILLSDKWVAKVSDFGLAKVGPNTMLLSQAQVSTIVKGTFGYLDPEYYRCQKLTEKSDVYSFGVVLFETLCARPAVIPMGETEEEEYEKVNLAEWALHCYKMGTLDQIIDPYLHGKIAPACFKTFTDIARKCLADRGRNRPSMGDVLCNLELAMQQQNTADLQEDTEANGRITGDASVTISEEQLLQFGNSDQTPGVEFSDIMVLTGR